MGNMDFKAKLGHEAIVGSAVRQPSRAEARGRERTHKGAMTERQGRQARTRLELARAHHVAWGSLEEIAGSPNLYLVRFSHRNVLYQ